jgi:UDP-N-acetyl-D-mannosaminuronic acid dehydrogenase
MPSVCVLGLGYIGLPTAALMASRGVRVHGVDVNPRVVETISKGGIHIVEADLEGLVRKVVTDGALTAHAEPVAADAFMITVPTPLRDGKKPDLDYVFAAGRAIAPKLKKGDVVILESTSPVGTTKELAKVMAKARPDLTFPGMGAGEPDVSVAYCPERVLPGRILIELVENDRCVGGLTPGCTARAIKVYEAFVRGAILATTAATAELVKLSENAFRDVNIAFANELSLVAERHDIDVWEAIELANRHPRVNILKPGPGVGGHCIAVDPWFIVDAAPEEARLIRTAREVNDHKPRHVLEKVALALKANPNAEITCFGLAFKANVDDLRESPSLEIVEHLAKAHPGRVAAVEPYIDEAPKSLAEAGVPLITLEQALAREGVYLLLVDHTAFVRLPLGKLAGRAVIDTRGVWRNAERAR